MSSNTQSALYLLMWCGCNIRVFEEVLGWLKIYNVILFVPRHNDFSPTELLLAILLCD